MISENRALMILTREGHFTEGQADIVLAHALQERQGSATLYQSEYIYKRARENRRTKAD